MSSFGAIKSTGCNNIQKTKEAAGEVSEVVDSSGFLALEESHAFCSFEL